MSDGNNSALRTKELPEIDCVIIGINCSRTLADCIGSVRKADYPQEKLQVIYVDGGSTDASVEVARRFPGVRVVSLHREYPTPGSGRNAGWKAGSAPFVQFLDSDTLVDRGWLDRGVETIMDDEKLGAVFGRRDEMHPESSVYNWIGNLEWNPVPGESAAFGGDVLVRRKALEKTGGYDEVLVGGEDPELSRRIIRSGWRILHLDAPMTRHDLAMKTHTQYLKRAFRSGYGFAAVRVREAGCGSDFWSHDVAKIELKGGGFLFSMMLALLFPFTGHTLPMLLLSTMTMAAGTVLLLTPRLFRVSKFMRELSLDRDSARRYAWHCSLVVVPQLFGVIRFHAGDLLGRPLCNRRSSLGTNLSTTVS
jgi:cellulose synthase/poly-beta-1,6-N-acetylglucosamine synthase-like glycosyltransferase